MMDTRSISMGHARALLGLEDEGERVRLAQMIAPHQWSVRETESQVRKAAQARSPRSSPQLAVVSEIMRARGLRVDLHQRADGSGKIVIEFDDAGARDAALGRLGTLEP
jgi:ParB family chromosome partitioning protein